MTDWYRLAGPLLRALPPETAHRLAVRALAAGLVPASRGPDDEALATRVWGLDFANPVGIAAGFDKDAEAVDGLFTAGFGSVEAGTVTPQPQAGNPKPRLFRLTDDRALINRLGFNSQGLARVVPRLGRVRAGILGINIGANRDSEDPVADYVAGFQAVCDRVDYVAVNISSPNTPGLRDLQTRGNFERLVGALDATREALVSGGARRVPIAVKVAPDLDERDAEDIAAVALETGLDGLIVGNTTLARDGVTGRHQGEAGGLSGPPLFARSTELLARFHRLTRGRVPLIGVGGIASGADAYAKIRAGASLVQLYTALVYQGPGLVARIKAEDGRVMKVVATGGLAPLFAGATACIEVTDPDLTLRGLLAVHRANRQAAS